LNRQVTVQGDWVLYEKHLKDACNPLLALGLCTDERLKNTWAEFGLEPPEPFKILPRIPFLRLGTDFDGMGTPSMALRALHMPFQHVFGSEQNKNARKTIEANGSPGILYQDASVRNCFEAPLVDLYVAGPPCQPFSPAGKGHGVLDRRGGLMREVCIQYIRKRQPRAFVLENAAALMWKPHKDILSGWVQTLEGLGYSVSVTVMNTEDHGVPQHRERCYIVGVRSDAGASAYAPPSPVVPATLSSFLSKHFGEKRPMSAGTSSGLERAIDKVFQQGLQVSGVSAL
jgi:DNA-cytosine methyltransferase